MSLMKRAWIAPWEGTGLVKLCLESAHPLPPYRRIHVSDMVFPAEPTPDNPLRHTMAIGLLDREDLETLRERIDLYLVEGI